jgi:tetratricopeptide (TPR) repeat protein
MPIPVIDAPFYREPYFQALVFFVLGAVLSPIALNQRNKRKEKQELFNKLIQDFNEARNTYSIANNPETAIKKFETLISITSKQKFPALYGLIRFYTGCCYTKLIENFQKEEDIRNALLHFSEAIPNLRGNKNRENLLGCYYNLATLFCTLAGIRDKKENLQKGITEFKTLIQLG